MAGRGGRRPTPWLPRFVAKVDRSGDCWLWTGYRQPSGYGRFAIRHHPDYAHRIAYQLAYGPIPSGMDVCHTCDNPPCVRPEHLFLGTAAENTADMLAKGRHKTPFRSDRGQSLVEFALVAPLMMFLLLGVLAAGFAFLGAVQQAAGAAEIARWAAANPEAPTEAFDAFAARVAPCGPATAAYEPDLVTVTLTCPTIAGQMLPGIMPTELVSTASAFVPTPTPAP